MAAVLVFGLISFSRLGISQLPDVDFPVVNVSLTENGAAPEVIESQVIDPIEDAIMELDGIKNVTSTAQQSSGSIAVEFELNQNIDRAMEQIQNKIDQVKNILPIDLFPPIIRKTNPEDMPIVWLAMTSDDPATKRIDMMIYARNFLFDQLSVVPGVGNVVLGGYVDPALRVWLDLNRLKKLNLTSDDVVSAIKTEQIEIPAGQMTNAQKDFNVRVLGEANSPEDFGRIMIQNRANLGPNYRTTQLKEVATVEEGTADVRRMARFNGKDAVGLGIVKQHGANAVEVAQLIRSKVAELQPLLPPHYHLIFSVDNTRFIQQSVKQLLFTLILSALLTSVVCYLFLGSWTSTINVLLAIPTSIIGTFVVFYFCNFTLNTFTLLGLSLAIGIVVDDAIMMLENIVRHRELGESRRSAALKGANEISFAAMAATVAVVAIFAPVIFMKGIIGKFFLQYGVTVSAAVLLSLLEALTLTPMRCSRFLVVHSSPKGLTGMMDRLFSVLSEKYRSLLEVLLRHRWKTVAGSLLLFVLSIFVAKLLPGEMMPAQDQGMILLRFKLPVGTSMEVTNRRIKHVEEYLATFPEIKGDFSAVGGFGGDAVNQGMAFVSLVDAKSRKRSQFELMNIFKEHFKNEEKGMEIVVQDLSLRGFSASRGFPVEFIIQGPDWEKLTSLTTEVMDKMKKTDYLTDVNTDVQQNMPETQIIPDRTALGIHGVSLNTVTSQLNAMVGGQIITGLNEYPKGRHRYEIEMRLVASQRDQIPALDQIELRNNRGETVKLSEVVTETHRPSLMLISRLNRARAITVYANPAKGHSQQEVMEKTTQLVKASLPPGYMMKLTGSSQGFKESFLSLFFALILGLVVSYMVLASQFDSFIHPITVLMALPFSFSGAFLALWIGHQSINMYRLIGFILLMGIVKKNSILLVDFTNQVRSEGVKDVKSALLKACPVRLRPIIMTSTATVAGALPEALALGPGSETTIPMAFAIIGGVIASSILTLFVVPVVYSLFTKLERPDPLVLAENTRL